MNIFELPARLMQDKELEEILLQDTNSGVRIERIISAGQVSPPGFWYDQAQNEWVLLLQGQAELTWEDGSVVSLQKGEWLFIPAHMRHRVSWTSSEPPCIWLAVHYGK